MAKVGRPSKYKEEFIPIMLDLGKAGKLPASVASTFGVSKQTLHDWREQHEEFSDAWDIYRESAETWWLDLAQRQAAGEQGGNAQMTKYMLAAAFDMVEKKAISQDLTTGGNKMEVPSITIVQPAIDATVIEADEEEEA